MAVFKCKMCGGDLNITEADKVVECEYCGTTQTVPSADNEKKMTLFNRANRLRLNNEFDKAAALYEQLIAEFPEEAEAYWGLCLCNWGIEYVDDPATGEKKPTCHRASFESLMKDENYLLAMEYADITAQRVYRREAQEIDRLNDAILSVSRNEKPYDVFICYKETDENGMRTHDSVLAQDVYDALTAKGLKVFFSRITLEDKLGRQYEPYIFAALNSAKVMLAIGTKYEYFQAVWVKNEWSRFMRLAAKDRSKVLIPCFRDMDPYDLPDEFKGLQAQDLGKLGAVQDLVRGVGKLLAKDAPKDGDVQQAAVSNPAATTVQSLLKRAFMFLEDGEWGSANEYAEKVLDIDPEDGEAYLAKAMSDLKKRSRSSMNDASGIALNANIQKALRFGSGSLKNEINDYIESTKAAEAADQLEADKVIAAFSARQSGRQAQPLVQQLAAAKQRASYIEKICGGYDKTAAQIKQLNGEKTAANSRLNTLRSKRDSLGLFAVKERKRLVKGMREIFRKKKRRANKKAILSSERTAVHMNWLEYSTSGKGVIPRHLHTATQGTAVRQFAHGRHRCAFRPAPSKRRPLPACPCRRTSAQKCALPDWRSARLAARQDERHADPAPDNTRPFPPFRWQAAWREPRPPCRGWSFHRAWSGRS